MISTNLPRSPTGHHEHPTLIPFTYLIHSSLLTYALLLSRFRSHVSCITFKSEFYLHLLHVCTYISCTSSLVSQLPCTSPLCCAITPEHKIRVIFV